MSTRRLRPRNQEGRYQSRQNRIQGREPLFQEYYGRDPSQFIRPGRRRGCSLPPLRPHFVNFGGTHFYPVPVPLAPQGLRWGTHVGGANTVTRVPDPIGANNIEGRGGVITLSFLVGDLARAPIVEGSPLYPELADTMQAALHEWALLPRAVPLCLQYTMIHITVLGECLQWMGRGAGRSPDQITIPNMQLGAAYNPNWQWGQAIPNFLTGPWTNVMHNVCHTESGSQFEAQRITIRFIVRGVPIGGCLDGTHPQMMKIDGMKLRNLPAVRNNCFFKVMREGLGLTKIPEFAFSVLQCNRIRERFDLEPDCMIPINVGLEMCTMPCGAGSNPRSM